MHRPRTALNLDEHGNWRAFPICGHKRACQASTAVLDRPVGDHAKEPTRRSASEEIASSAFASKYRTILLSVQRLPNSTTRLIQESFLRTV